MKAWGHLWPRIVRDEAGATLVEYSILIGLLTGSLLLTITAVGDRVATQWLRVDAALSGTSSGGSPENNDGPQNDPVPSNGGGQGNGNGQGNGSGNGKGQGDTNGGKKK